MNIMCCKVIINEITNDQYKIEHAVQRKFKRLKTVQFSGKENINLENIPIRSGYFNTNILVVSETLYFAQTFMTIKFRLLYAQQYFPEPALN